MIMRTTLPAVAAVLALAAAGPAATQGIFQDLDQPCSAQFANTGRESASRFVPAGLPPAMAGQVRGVVRNAILWRPGETLTVCFRSGTTKARQRIARLAGEWQRHAAVSLDFGDADNPRTCSGNNTEAIKIDFVSSGPNAGYWSAIGTTSRRQAHSMNLSGLGGDDLPRDRQGNQMPEQMARRIVLHEFGHAIGLYHEHQSPKNSCVDEYYEDAVLAYGASMGWPPQQTIQNFAQLPNSKEFNATDVDLKSIMFYAMPPWLFRTGEKSTCYIKPNNELSDTDKLFVASLYPRPVAMNTRGAVPSAKASIPRDGLVAEYQRALSGSGIPADRQAKLVEEFKAFVAAQ